MIIIIIIMIIIIIIILMIMIIIIIIIIVVVRYAWYYAMLPLEKIHMSTWSTCQNMLNGIYFSSCTYSPNFMTEAFQEIRFSDLSRDLVMMSEIPVETCSMEFICHLVPPIQMACPKGSRMYIFTEMLLALLLP